MKEAASKPENFRADIQGLRALAVLLVMAYHAELPIRAGFLGVDVFFVISGFVIGSVILREIDSGRGFSISRFISRRIRRILPAAGVVVVLVVGASILLESPNGPQQNTAKAAIGSSLMVANFVFPRLIGDYFSPSVESNPLLHMWSLSVEEQFYFGLALILAVVFVGARESIVQRRRFLATSWLGLLVSFALMMVWSFEIVAVPGVLGGSSGLFFSAPSRAWQFAIGLILAASPRLSRGLTKVPSGRAIGLLIVLVSCVWLSDSSDLPGPATLLPVIGALLVLAPSVGNQNLFERAVLASLSSRPARWIGDRSYSLYLWHWPAVVFVKWREPGAPPWLLVVATGLSFLPAVLSFRFLESPLRRWSPQKFIPVLLLGAFFVFAPLVSGLTLGQGSSRGWGQDWTLGAHEIKRRDCDSGAFDPERCSWDVEGSRANIVLVGDSQGWSYGDAVIDAARNNRTTTTALVLNNCPFVGVAAESEEFVGGACAGRQREVMAYLELSRPSHLVIANLTSGYVSSDEHAEKWIAALARALQDVRDLGIQPVVILTSPLGDEDSGTGTLLLRPATPRFKARSVVDEERALAVSADLGAVALVPGVEIIDPADVLCSPVQCEVADAGGEMYSDRNHLSVRAVNRLVPILTALLAPNAAVPG